MSNEEYQMETAEDAIKIALAMSAEKATIDSVVMQEIDESQIISIKDSDALALRNAVPVAEPEGPYVEIFLETNEQTGKSQLIADYDGIRTSFVTPFLKEYITQTKEEGSSIPYGVGNAILANEKDMIDTFFRPDAAQQRYRAEPAYIRSQIRSLMQEPVRMEGNVIKMPQRKAKATPPPLPEAAYAGRR